MLQDMKPEAVQAEWGKRVKRLRLLADLTATYVAEQVGISRRYLNAIERGKYAPSLAVQLRIAEVLDANPAVLFSLELEQTPSEQTP